MSPTQPRRAWPTFRRVFLWTLAAYVLGAGLRADAAPPTVTDADWQVTIRPSQTERGPEQLAFQPEDLSPTPAAVPPAPVSHDEQRSPAAEVSKTQFGDWTVTVAPQPARSPATVHGRTYEEVYASIPYRRAEYLAEPGYRHQATMEILFGQLRPTTVVRHNEPRIVPTPKYSVYKPYRYSQTELYNYWHAAGAYSFGQFVTPFYPVYPRQPMLY